METKFCTSCGSKITAGTTSCPKCGQQLTNPQIIINNTNTNTNTNAVGSFGKKCNKWVAFWLCFFLGIFGGHKFYEGKTGMGILYIFTAGLFGIGYLIDLVTILCKPNPYYA